LKPGIAICFPAGVSQITGVPNDEFDSRFVSRLNTLARSIAMTFGSQFLRDRESRGHL
jgi:hypothetical protein